MTKLRISEVSKNPVINIAIDTINLNKQALVFCSSRRTAEKQATDIAKNKSLKNKISHNLNILSQEFLDSLPNHTTQCEKNANCIKKGIAFHHAGLVSKQREIIETNFKNGNIKIICSTPTLAVGLDMPAFRTILKDLKRYSGKWGMQYIPVLEYEQMAGRAGRPGKEDYGEAIAISSSPGNKLEILENYINSDVEKIQSKLAVEPVLRTYVLSLVSTGFIKTKEQLFDFFKKTFYAKQFGDLKKVEDLIDKVINLLIEFKFLKGSSKEEKQDNSLFTSAKDLIEKQTNSDNQKLEATKVGIRVSQLYLDPLTANKIIKNLEKTKTKFQNQTDDNIQFSLLQTLSNTIEMQPLLKLSQKDGDSLQFILANASSAILQEIPDPVEFEYDDFLRSIKTAAFFRSWISESSENEIIEKYNMQPGDTRAKINQVDWLLKCSIELARFSGLHNLISELNKIQTRIKYGAKEELIPLLKLENIGRIRARKLFQNNIKSISDIKKMPNEDLIKIIGEKIAKKVKEQLGQTFESKIKHSGNLNDYF